MSFARFLFGNVDEEGKLSDSELNDELKETLGGEDADDYLSGVLGGALFNDGTSGDQQQKKKRKRGAEESDSDDDKYSGPKTGGTATPANMSSAIRPAKDAIDFSDFNELADDAAVPTNWGPPGELTSTSTFKYSSSIARAQVDDDYDSEEENEKGKDGGASDLFATPAAPVVGSESVLAVMTEDEAAVYSVDNHDLPIDSDEESLEDLFDSSAKPSAATAADKSLSSHDDAAASLGKVPAAAMTHMDASVAEQSIPDQDSHRLEPKEDTSIVHHPAVPRVPKKIPPGIIKFTDYFGCQVVRQTRKPRRIRQSERDDDEDHSHNSQQRLLLVQPALDTRKLLSGTQRVPKQVHYLKEFLSRSMAADSKSDLYITIDANTGAATSQTMMPKRNVMPSSELFQRMPYPLDIENWESQVVWEDSDDTQRAKESAFGEEGSKPVALKILEHSKSSLLEDFESHIIWDPDTPFQPCTQLQINMNDTHMLFEDANSIKESHAREAERQRLIEGVDRFNLSNDHFYEALQGGKVHRVRQTFGQLIIAHSLPSLRLQPPYFKMRNTRNELRSLHRPFFQAPLDTKIQFSRVRTAKKRKQKHSMENPWASKDITLKDSADCVLIEYSEEYPPVMSNVGMGSVFVNYYRKRDNQDLAFPQVDLGELFILDVADISPFLNFGNIEPGQVVPALYNNMFRAPLFQQKVKKTDFLVVKHTSKGETK
ncbi:hypothetical protein EV175_000958, partial [Coemansia sp. RSA 1933]